MTEVWFRNPDLYVRELVEVGEYKMAWDRGMLHKKHIDLIKHAGIYFGKTYPWRALAIGHQGTAEYRDGDTIDKPTAVYPTWTYGDDAALLEEIIANPVGQDADLCATPGIPGDELPVFGQEHRVVICGIPDSRSGPGRAFLVHLNELQQDYPDCIIHLHGLYGFRAMFSNDIGAVDVDPRTNAAKGRVTMPSGRDIPHEQASVNPQWVTVLGFKPKDLEVPRNRCMYNIKSAVWCGTNFSQLFKFKSKGSGEVDKTTPNQQYKAPETDSYLSSRKKGQEGDRFLCDTCSLAGDCKYARDGSVCSVPGAEPKELATYFRTRDADLIIDGLGLVMAAGAKRLERGYRAEQVLRETDPEVTKMQGQVFDQGIKLAKLLDPNLRAGAKVQVNVGGGSAVQVNNGNPREAVAAAVRELESRGIPRDQITPQMIANIFASVTSPEDRDRAIEGVVVAERTDE